MNGSGYYYDGNDDSPTLSPSSATFDHYLGHRELDDTSFFSMSPTDVLYSGLPQSAPYSISPRASLGQRDVGFPLGFLSPGESLQEQYHGSDLSLAQTMRNSSHLVTYRDQTSAGSTSPQVQSTSALDGASFFLPSPPEAEESSYHTSPEAMSDKRSEKRKRRASQNSKANSKATSKSTISEAPPAQGPTTQLRTAPRSQKRQPSNTGRPKTVGVTEDVKARATHNHVEQQYRKRLNNQFERLLAVLPQPEREGGGDEANSDDPDDGRLGKRISKAEVLDLARRRIKTLESERAVLEMQKRELAGCVNKLRGEWARRLGSEVPIKMEG